jgi:hypothetical protein
VFIRGPHGHGLRPQKNTYLLERGVGIARQKAETRCGRRRRPAAIDGLGVTLHQCRGGRRAQAEMRGAFAVHVVWLNVEPSNSGVQQLPAPRLSKAPGQPAARSSQPRRRASSLHQFHSCFHQNAMGQGSSTLDALTSITQRLLTENLLPDDSIWSNILQVFGFTCSMQTFPAVSPTPFSLARLDFSVRSCNYSFPLVNIFEK